MTQFPDRSGEGGWGAARADLNQSLNQGLEQSERWHVVRHEAPTAELLAEPIAERRTLRWCTPTDTALVTGNRAHEGLKRKSGGGSVLIRPGRLIWADVIIPRTDPNWIDDVRLSSVWIGHAWANAFKPLGVAASVYDGPKITSDGACFAGIVPGEVAYETPPRTSKLVGISQRRTKSAALFQTAVLRTTEPDETLAIGLDEILDVDRAVVEAAFERSLV